MKEHLTTYLKTHQMNYSTFAKLNGFSPQNIEQWAKGKNEPSMKNYIKLMKILG
jgi:DNA-binding XRE family transcriptional regulator